MANKNRYYKTPFAESGDKTEVPNESTGGAVGYDTGFGPDYELPQGTVNRKRIERDMWNGLQNGVTGNLKQWQEKLYPTWIEDNGDGVAFSYSEGMIVSHNNVNYVSLEGVNQEEPGTGGKWSIKVSDINELSLPYVFDTVADMTASSIDFPVGKILTTREYFSGTGIGGASYTVTSGTSSNTFGDHNLSNGKFAKLDLPEDGWAKTQQFGMLFNADYEDYLATGNTNASTSEHERWQECADWCRENKLNMLMQEGTVLLDGPIRVWLWPSTGEAVVCKGQGVGKTRIFNTIQNSTGDLLVNIPVGGQNSDEPGLNIWQDFTILETGRGDLDGTGGVNAIAGAFAEGVIVRQVDIEKAGNRAVNVEGLGRLRHYELDNVNIKDSWKNGFTAGGWHPTLPCRMKLHNVEVDGWNIIASQVGGLTNENIGGNITSTTEDITQYITGYVRFKNGFCTAFRNLSTPIHGDGELSAKNVTITDFRSATQATAIYLGRVGEQTIPQIDVDGVVAGGGVLTTNNADASMTFKGIKVRNAELFDLHARCFVRLMNPDFDRRGETSPAAAFRAQYAGDVFNGFINGGSIIAQIPIGDISNNLVNVPLSRYNIDGCSIIETGSRDGNDYFTQTDFTDLRKAWNIDSLPNDWVLRAGFTSTLREPNGLRMRNYESNNSEFIQLDTKVNSGAGLYTIRIKLSEADSNAIRFYASHGSVSDDVLVTLTTTTTEFVISGYQFTDDDVTFKIGRTDNMALGTNKVIEYLKIELEP